MPPYLRKRRFRGWDWFTPRFIHHLPWQDKERLMEEAWNAVRRHPYYRVTRYALPLMFVLSLGLVATGEPLGFSPFLQFPMSALCFLALVASFFWQHWRFLRELRNILRNANIRPAFCFECGYDLEGFEGKDCPVCDCPLLREDNAAASEIAGQR